MLNYRSISDLILRMKTASHLKISKKSSKYILSHCKTTTSPSVATVTPIIDVKLQIHFRSDSADENSVRRKNFQEFFQIYFITLQNYNFAISSYRDSHY